jgi:hypothetical protein
MESELMSKYRSVVIDDQLLYYETHCDDSEVGTFYWTDFFKEVEAVTKRKWLIFGEKRQVAKPKVLFTIAANSQDTSLNKEWWREKIMQKLSLVDREEQIKRGELI